MMQKKKNKALLEKIEPDDLVHFGLIPELIGRLHVIASLNELNEEDMVRILTEPKMPLLSNIKSFLLLMG